MKKNISIILSLLLPLCLISNFAVGAEALTHDEAVTLLKGNTAEGVNTKWDKNMIWYFREDGTVIKQNQSGNRFNHTWSIDKKGQLCYQDGRMDWPECHPVKQRADGKYDAHDGRWRMDKILQGNAHKF